MADFKAAFEGKLKDTFSSKNQNSVIPSEPKHNAYISRLPQVEEEYPLAEEEISQDEEISKGEEVSQDEAEK